MTFSLPHWMLTLAWWLELAFTISGFFIYVARLVGHRWSIEPPKTVGGRVWHITYLLMAYGACAIVLALARRAL